MKNFVKIVALGLALPGLLVGCKKELDENLYSQVGTTNVNGPEGSKLLVNGIYGYVQFFSYFRGNHWLLDTEAGTDEFFCNWGGWPDTGWAGQQNFLNLDPGHYQVGLKWDQMYALIAQANTVVTQYGAATDAVTKQNVAEARFWRAYAYDKLYRVYGPVPLVKGGEDLSNGIGRASAAELENFIETELKAVETVLPSAYPASDYGRPTKWAVKAFLARYYLNQKRWQPASDYAKDVITNSGHTLMPDYQSVFSQNGNNEVILAVNHATQPDKGNKYVALSLEAGMTNALGISGVSSSNGYGMSIPFFRSFAPGDLRIAPYNPATGKGISVSGILRKSDGTPVYGTPAAPRTVEQFLSRVVTFKFPVQMNIPKGEDSNIQMPLLRLAETMLTYAEAQNELGNSSEAVRNINLLRTRAGLAGTPATGQAALRDAILNERGWELYHEGYRREDLVRQGQLLNRIAQKYAFYSAFLSPTGTTTPWPNAGQTYRILQPLPSTALQLNRQLQQNPGY